MSSRDLDVYYDDGKGGIEQARLKPGRESTTNSYEGHSFFVTPVNNKTNIINRFTIEANKVLYLIEDPEYPISDDVLLQSREEGIFIEKYRNETGLAWRHYFGPNGPRPPPKLFMWPADAVGDVHSVKSSSGYWYLHTLLRHFKYCIDLSPHA